MVVNRVVKVEMEPVDASSGGVRGNVGRWVRGGGRFIEDDGVHLRWVVVPNVDTESSSMTGIKVVWCPLVGRLGEVEVADVAPVSGDCAADFAGGAETYACIGSSSSKKVISSSYWPITEPVVGSHLQPSILSTAEKENKLRTDEPYLCFIKGTRLLIVILASSANSGKN